MKRGDLLRHLRKHGCHLKREGRSESLWTNPRTGSVEARADLAAKNAAKTIPIVMLGVGDPIGSGLVASLARPGGNVTGLSLFSGLEIVGKSLELLKEAVPTVSRVAVLINPSNPVHLKLMSQLGEISVVAERLRLKLQISQVSGPSEFESAFRSATQERADALERRLR